MLHAKEIMTVDPVCVGPHATLREAVEQMTQRDCGAVPVVANEGDRRLVGIITDRDIAKRLAEGGEIADSVESAMTSPVATVTPETTLEACCQRMMEFQVRRLVVVSETGQCLGIIAQADLARHLPEADVGALVKQISEPSLTGLA